MIIKGNKRDKKFRLFFFIKKKKKEVNYKNFLKKNKVHDLIKFSRNDFKYLIRKKKFFTHFNIHKTVHKPGKKYLLVKIYKKGYSYNKQYIYPILDIKDFILAKCIYSKNFINYEDLKKKNFKFSIKNIKSVKQLKNRILLRYRFSMARMSKKDKLSLGVAITRLKILKIMNTIRLPN